MDKESLKKLYDSMGGSSIMSFDDFMKEHHEEFENDVLLQDSNLKIFFISGHRDITQDEFDKYYIPAIDKAIKEYENCKFVVGDYYGADIMAQTYLKRIGINPKRVTVYHMLEKPRNLATSTFNIKGGYKSDEERDSAMTEISDFDIAWIRKGKNKSGTAQNVLRRHMMK